MPVHFFHLQWPRSFTNRPRKIREIAPVVNLEHLVRHQATFPHCSISRFAIYPYFVTFKKYLVLLAIVCFGSTGDTLLSRGMRDVGEVHLNDLGRVVGAIANPWVAVGILCLLIFFGSYLASLSWADLTYVLPATAVGYVVLALLSKFFLHEQVSLARWAGIGLITAGVGFVAGGPPLTEHEQGKDPANLVQTDTEGPA